MLFFLLLKKENDPFHKINDILLFLLHFIGDNTSACHSIVTTYTVTYQYPKFCFY